MVRYKSNEIRNLALDLQRYHQIYPNVTAEKKKEIEQDIISKKDRINKYKYPRTDLSEELEKINQGGRKNRENRIDVIRKSLWRNFYRVKEQEFMKMEPEEGTRGRKQEHLRNIRKFDIKNRSKKAISQDYGSTSKNTLELYKKKDNKYIRQGENYKKWSKDPGKYDLKGIDTKERGKKLYFPKKFKLSGRYEDFEPVKQNFRKKETAKEYAKKELKGYYYRIAKKGTFFRVYRKKRYPKSKTVIIKNK